jgi:nucleotide-binding universal stress UspA family protein
MAFPWPRESRVSGVIGAGTVPPELPERHRRALEAGDRRVAAATRAALEARWPRADVAIVSGPVARAILAESRRRRAQTIVVGEQRRAAVARFFLGSISRRIVREARCSVLVVRGRPKRIASIVMGVDGSRHARRAVDLVARLVPGRGGRVTVVRVLEPVSIPSLELLPTRVRRTLSAEATALHARRLRAARQEVDGAVSRLSRAGWSARAMIRIGGPAGELLRAAAGADLLVVGARGARGVKRLLLGSVADAVLARCPVSVLLTR